MMDTGFGLEETHLLRDLKGMDQLGVGSVGRSHSLFETIIPITS